MKRFLQRLREPIHFIGGEDDLVRDDDDDVIRETLVRIAEEHPSDPIDAMRDPNILQAAAQSLPNPDYLYYAAKLYISVLQFKVKEVAQRTVTKMISDNVDEEGDTLETLKEWLLDPFNVRPYALQFKYLYARHVFYNQLDNAVALLNAEMQYEDAMAEWNDIVDAWLRGELSVEDAERYRQGIVGEYREQFLRETADDLSWERWVIYRMRQLVPDDDVVDKYVLVHPGFRAPKTKRNAEYMVDAFARALEKVGTEYDKLMPTFFRYTIMMPEN